jgi:predicted type IV restriction endonuclease
MLLSETQNVCIDDMQLNSTHRQRVSTATTVTRTGHNVAIYMYIVYLVYTAIAEITSKKKKNAVFSTVQH